MEACWWLFVFVAWAVWRTSEGEEMATSGQWYLVYRYRWQGKRLVQEKYPCDGCFASNTEAAEDVAASRVDYRSDEELVAVYCKNEYQRQLASDLDGRHVCEWWSQNEFLDNMIGPTYSGDQDKYTCKKDAKK